VALALALVGGVVSPEVLDTLEGHLRRLYEGEPLGAVAHDAVPTPAAPATTDTAVCYLGGGKYVLYIVSVDAVPGLGDAVAGAPERFAGVDQSTLPPHFDEMGALEWTSLPALLQAAADQASDSEASESCRDSDAEFESDTDDDSYDQWHDGSSADSDSGSDAGSGSDYSGAGVVPPLLST
jgi:hypothetical protein